MRKQLLQVKISTTLQVSNKMGFQLKRRTSRHKQKTGKRFLHRLFPSPMKQNSLQNDYNLPKTTNQIQDISECSESLCIYQDDDASELTNPSKNEDLTFEVSTSFSSFCSHAEDSEKRSHVHSPYYRSKNPQTPPDSPEVLSIRDSPSMRSSKRTPTHAEQQHKEWVKEMEQKPQNLEDTTDAVMETFEQIMKNCKTETEIESSTASLERQSGVHEFSKVSTIMLEEERLKNESLKKEIGVLKKERESLKEDHERETEMHKATYTKLFRTIALMSKEIKDQKKRDARIHFSNNRTSPPQHNHVIGNIAHTLRENDTSLEHQLETALEERNDLLLKFQKLEQEYQNMQEKYQYLQRDYHKQLGKNELLEQQLTKFQTPKLHPGSCINHEEHSVSFHDISDYPMHLLEKGENAIIHV